MDKRYLKNLNMLTEAEVESLGNRSVCVVGCGGLGGYVIEMLGRLGIGKITAVDGDLFEETNLNRQLLSDTGKIGQGKAAAAKARMLKVNPLVEVTPVSVRITAKNGIEILEGHDVIIDASDNAETRLLLQELALWYDVPLVHGAIAGWYGQATTVLPGDRTLDLLYGRQKLAGMENRLGNPSFTPALIASIQVSETLKLLIGKGEVLSKKVLYIDSFEHEYVIIPI